MKNIVVKLGGSVLKDVAAIADAANWVKKLVENGYGVVVVVSALKGVTDELINTVKNLSKNPDPSLMDEILAMGERTSVRLFTLALREHGINALFIDPSDERWPIITNDRHLDAEPIYEETKKRVEEKLIPLISKGVVPVICGFIGVTLRGEITTLGRGGSDTTAVLLGSCLDSEEIVLVKDVPGIFSADPDIVEDARILNELDFKEVQALIRGGSKIIHTKALRYLRKKLKLRIASLKELLSDKGTIIKGYDPEIEVYSPPLRIVMATIIGEHLDGVQVYEKLITKLKDRGVKIIALTSEEQSMILYVEEKDGIIADIHSSLVSNELGKAVSFYQDLAMLVISGRMLETSPGIIYRVTKPLAEAGINIYGLLTISSSIRLIISRGDIEKTKEMLVEELKNEKVGE
ncbi:MAG: aspartate kinase [Aigarchaeota archaeon]|nr:aspartate kinase [Aigarchaeota archaeon]MCX8193004.1 aspartate kinase [Nitrososphaeria archaeon]MDW7986260.1 aspartate kinase [Nitrososphaerota archaeon]